MSDSNNNGGSGCAGLLGFIGVVALACWAFFDMSPKAAVIFAFKAYGGLLLVLFGVLAVVLLCFGVAFVWAAIMDRRDRRASRKWRGL